MPSTTQPQILRATYNSPSNPPFTHTQKISTLSELRKARAVLQEQINTELTRRMEEDNDKAAGGKSGKSGVDEGKEEENYGEEVVEED